VNAADKVRLELLDEFRQTTAERIEKISLGWMALEKNPTDTAASEDLPRQLHTLKGEAKVMGFADVSLVAHRTEELVHFAKTRGFKVDDRFGDVILSATDTISALLQKRAGASCPGIDLAVLFERFDTVLKEGGADAPSDGPDVSVRENPTPKASEPDLSCARVVPEQFLRVDRNAINGFSEIVSEMVVTHSRYEHALSLLKQLDIEYQETIADLDLMQDMAPKHNGQTRSDATSPRALIAFAALQTRLHGIVESLGRQVYEGSVRAQEAEHRIRALRLVPVRDLLNKYVRVVRDLAVELGKTATAEVADAAVSLDKVVVDKIAEPLLHLVRNSVDHGLEAAPERKNAGKPESGRVMLSAAQEGGYVTVVIEDDGRGVDFNNVRQRAVDLALTTKDEADALDEEELWSLLFKPGFSTRKIATETSGRGVGLDVVKREVELLGGTVRAQSRLGQGTRFELRVPVDVSLTRVLVVRVGDANYAVPCYAVASVSTVAESRIEIVSGRRAVRFGARPIPLVELSSLVNGDAPEASCDHAIVVGQEGNHVALLVEELRGDVDVIVKPLGDCWKETRLCAGACSLKEGDLALVLNPTELVSRALGEIPRIQSAAATAEEHVEKKKILLAEDSTITRTMIARLLIALGYDVHEAVDGMQALRSLDTEKFDLILTDVEMPNLDGIGLIRQVRKLPSFRTVPIVVLSTRGSDADKKMAVEAGADAYLVKTDFSEGALKEAISRRIGR
jgi:two-component system, chemotaxis family, sensor kinase CheA